MADDLLIRGATLFDGSGGEPFTADVAVKAGRIRAIAPSLPADAGQVIDAQGLALMPGIIDSHTHFDAQITWDPYVRPSPALGVTTAVIGNCGFTIAPCRPADRERTMRNLTQVEGMSLDVLRQGIRWEFETFAEYLAQLRRSGSALNLACYVGHSSVRTWVMGDDAAQREATPDEIERMAAVIREAMDAGAVGLASSTSPAHNGEGGVPMPSRLASDAEHLALIQAMAHRGGGVYMITKGGEMPVALLEEMAARAGRASARAQSSAQASSHEPVTRTSSRAAGRRSAATLLATSVTQAHTPSATPAAITKRDRVVRPSAGEASPMPRPIATAARTCRLRGSIRSAATTLPASAAATSSASAVGQACAGGHSAASARPTASAAARGASRRRIASSPRWPISKPSASSATRWAGSSSGCTTPPKKLPSRAESPCAQAGGAAARTNSASAPRAARLTGP